MNSAPDLWTPSTSDAQESDEDPPESNAASLATENGVVEENTEVFPSSQTSIHELLLAAFEAPDIGAPPNTSQEFLTSEEQPLDMERVSAQSSYSGLGDTYQCSEQVLDAAPSMEQSLQDVSAMDGTSFAVRDAGGTEDSEATYPSPSNEENAGEWVSASHSYVEASYPGVASVNPLYADQGPDLGSAATSGGSNDNVCETDRSGLHDLYNCGDDQEQTSTVANGVLPSTHGGEQHELMLSDQNHQRNQMQNGDGVEDSHMVTKQGPPLAKDIWTSAAGMTDLTVHEMGEDEQEALDCMGHSRQEKSLGEEAALPPESDYTLHYDEIPMTTEDERQWDTCNALWRIASETPMSTEINLNDDFAIEDDRCMHRTESLELSLMESGLRQISDDADEIHLRMSQTADCQRGDATATQINREGLSRSLKNLGSRSDVSGKIKAVNNAFNCAKQLSDEEEVRILAVKALEALSRASKRSIKLPHADEVVKTMMDTRTNPAATLSAGNPQPNEGAERRHFDDSFFPDKHDDNRFDRIKSMPQTISSQLPVARMQIGTGSHRPTVTCAPDRQHPEEDNRNRPMSSFMASKDRNLSPPSSHRYQLRGEKASKVHARFNRSIWISFWINQHPTKTMCKCLHHGTAARCDLSGMWIKFTPSVLNLWLWLQFCLHLWYFRKSMSSGCCKSPPSNASLHKFQNKMLLSDFSFRRGHQHGIQVSHGLHL